jgi:hypothetical protein
MIPTDDTVKLKIDTLLKREMEMTPSGCKRTGARNKRLGKD